jgi:esterase
MRMLHFKQYGQGQPVLILHGLFGTLDNWQTVANQLAQYYTVFAVDLRNHGRSFHSDSAFTYQVLTDDIQRFMDDNWLYQTAVIGHSMGGKLAMNVALDDPDRITKLVVVDIAPKTYRGGHDDVFKALHSIDLATLRGRADAEVLLMNALNRDIPTVQFLLKNLSRRPAHEGGGFEWKMNWKVLERDYAEILKQIESTEVFENPTLFLRGGRSNYVKDADLVGIQQFFPNATLQTIPNAGHWVHADQPALLIQALLQFLA